MFHTKNIWTVCDHCGPKNPYCGPLPSIVVRKIPIVANFQPLWPNHGTYVIQLQYVYSMNISGSSIQANTSQIGSCLIRLRLHCIAVAGLDSRVIQPSYLCTSDGKGGLKGSCQLSTKHFHCSTTYCQLGTKPDTCKVYQIYFRGSTQSIYDSVCCQDLASCAKPGRLIWSIVCLMWCITVHYYI